MFSFAPPISACGTVVNRPQFRLYFLLIFYFYFYCIFDFFLLHLIFIFSGLPTGSPSTPGPAEGPTGGTKGRRLPAVVEFPLGNCVGAERSEDSKSRMSRVLNHIIAICMVLRRNVFLVS